MPAPKPAGLPKASASNSGQQPPAALAPQAVAGAAAADRRRLRFKQPRPAGMPAPSAPAALPGNFVARKRPAGAQSPSHFCEGYRAAGSRVHEACTFSTSTRGAPAQWSKEGRCLLCDSERLKQAAASSSGLKGLVPILKKLFIWPEQVGKAVARIRELVPEKADDLELRAKQPIRRRCRDPQGEAQDPDRKWDEAVSARMSSRKRLSAEEVEGYVAVCRKRQRRTAKKFCPGVPDLPRNNAKPQSTGIEGARRSELSKGLEAYCLRGSWGICGVCRVLQPRDLRELDIARTLPPILPKSACLHCHRQRMHFVPKPNDVPEPLRDLTLDIVMALRPLTIDVGPEWRSAAGGYRKHQRMIRFAWSERHVCDQIEDLPSQGECAKARAALRFLRRSETSSYRKFFDEHEKFLARFEDADNAPTLRERQRPLRFVEEIGLECALWPDLYWSTDMTETYERATDERRLARQRARRPKRRFAASSEDEAIDSDAQEGQARRHSTKRSFATKLFGPLLGYGADFELLQMVYDLNLWTALGSKKNAKSGIPMRLMMKGHSFSPEYWKAVHLSLVDLVKQVGFPTIFWTMAPFEPAFPYHRWIQDEMAKLLRDRTGLPVAETVHIAHVFVQLVRGALTGRNQNVAGREDRQWHSHLLSCKDDSGNATIVNFFTRLEFQDGQRKEGTQQYHGSGRAWSLARTTGAREGERVGRREAA